jgi:pimeloyl-ACP methyl ester carboxylesterase
MPYVETPGLKIHYRMAGTGSTPIVLIHGNYASSRWWEPMLANVPDAYRAFAPDLRGCGSRENHSTRRGPALRRFSIQDMAQDIEAFLTGLGIERAVIVGHSMGGLVATSFATLFADKVLALVLQDTGPAGGISLGSVTTPLLLPLEIKNRRMLRAALRRVGIPRTGALAEGLLEDALSAPRGLYYKFSRAAVAWKAEAALHRITAPTLLIWGRNDQVMPSHYSQVYLQRIPNARLVLIPNAGHSPHLEQPQLFADAFYAFLDDQIQAGKSVNTANVRLADTREAT